MWYYTNGIVGQQEIMSVCMFTFRFSEICSKAQKGVKNIVWLKRIEKPNTICTTRLRIFN